MCECVCVSGGRYGVEAWSVTGFAAVVHSPRRQIANTNHLLTTNLCRVLPIVAHVTKDLSDGGLRTAQEV